MLLAGHSVNDSFSLSCRIIQVSFPRRLHPQLLVQLIYSILFAGFSTACLECLQAGRRNLSKRTEIFRDSSVTIERNSNTSNE